MVTGQYPIRIINYSIVLVGTGFSPNTYNGDWYFEKNIIPEDWNWKVTSSISNNLFSNVIFDGGKIEAKVESAKFTFINNFFSETKFSETKLTDLVRNFLRRSKHLNFSAIGINFITVTEVENYNGYLKQNFISAEKYKIGGYELQQAGIKLMYPIKKGGRLTISLGEGEAEQVAPDNKTVIASSKGIVCDANFHRDYESNVSLIISQLNHIKEDWKMLENILKGLIK